MWTSGHWNAWTDQWAVGSGRWPVNFSFMCFLCLVDRLLLSKETIHELHESTRNVVCLHESPASCLLLLPVSGILLAPLPHNKLILLRIRPPRQRLDAETDSGLERLYRKITASKRGLCPNKEKKHGYLGSHVRRS